MLVKRCLQPQPHAQTRSCWARLEFSMKLVPAFRCNPCRVQVWNAATGGVMESSNTALNPRVVKGMVMRGILDSSDEDSDEYDE